MNDVTLEDTDLEKSQLNTRKPQKVSPITLLYIILTLLQTEGSTKKLTAFQKACGCLTLNYWSEFFEIDQTELRLRVMATLNPIKPSLAERIEEKPDLYGPFWICTTLIFMLLISESFWNVLNNMLTSKDKRNIFNFQQISWAVSLVYGAFLAFPMIFFVVNKLFGSSSSVLKCACIYGYSVFSLVLASFLSILPIKSFRYLFWISASIHSVVTLFTNLKG